MDSAVDDARPADPVLSSAREMDLYCRYLTGKSADAISQQLFARAVELELVKLDAAEERARHFILRNPWSVGPVDAAMGFFLPKHGLRRRMILAFAILEANPDYFENFQPRSFSVAHVLRLACRGAVEVFKAVIGRVILWLA